MVIKKNLGMCYGYRSLSTVDGVEPTMSQRLNDIYNGGIRLLRVNLPTYTTNSSNPTQRDQLRLICTTWLNLGTDTKVQHGLSVAGASFLTNTTMTGSYTNELSNMATWVSTLSSDQQGRFTLILGNEDDPRVDGVTVTTAQYQAYVRGTLCNTIKAIIPLSKVGYSTRNDYVSQWVSDGIGSLDEISSNFYKIEPTFDSLVLSMYNAFGTKAEVTEFGWLDESLGKNFYMGPGSDEYKSEAAWRQYEICKNLGINCYFFAYDVGSAATFSIRLVDGTYTNSWYGLTSNRTKYSQIYADV